jgi:GNAT superfamily N-acetyltransferase
MHMHTQQAVVARAEDRDRVAAAIALGFSTDPVCRWMYPDSRQFMSGFPTFVLAMGGRAFDHESAYCTADLSGAALWLPPGVTADEDAMGPHLERTVDPAKLEAVQATMEQMEHHHPSEPHWYLPLIGVDPARQRSGHGAALMRCALERVDRDGLPAYLESTNPRNIPLYQRHGFEVVATIQVGDVPPLFPMVRRPR